METCIFCKIVSGKIPANILYQGNDVIAFPDINAQAPHHVLIIPKKHFETLEDVGPQAMTFIPEMVQAARLLAAQLGIAERGYRLVMNVRPEGGQSVFHVHMHLLGGTQMGPSLVG